MINIVGLGATDYRDLTLKAIEVIENNKKNFIRTEKHKTVEYFKKKNIEYISFDYLYDKEDSFDDVYLKIVEKLLEEEKIHGEINYFVPGNPHVAERSVKELQKRSKNLNIVSGMSFIEPVLAAVKRDVVEGLIFLDEDFKEMDINLDKDVLITQVYNKRVASDVSLKLQEIYEEDDKCFVIIDAGMDTEIVKRVRIYEIPRVEEINHRTAIYIPRTERYDFNRLYEEIKKFSKNFYYEEEINKVKYNLEKLIKNMNEDNDQVVSEIFLQLLLLVSVAENEGYYNLNEISSKILMKIMENSDYFNKSVEKYWELGYNCNSLSDRACFEKI